MPFEEVEEKREVALITNQELWAAVGQKLNLPVAWKTEAREATESVWRTIEPHIRGDVIYAVGGGVVADAAKYLAAHRGLPLVCLPTALSVDAFLTWASGVREDGCVKYLETKCPERLVIDYSVLGTAPARIRAAAICDVLSIATGSWDWKYAEERGANPDGMPYSRHVSAIAAGILAAAIDCSEAAGKGDPGGLEQLLECLALEVQLCNLIGHARPEEGSEHYFAYSVENQMGKGLPHGDLVGPGILIMAQLQGQDTSPLRRALESCSIPLHSIPRGVIRDTLRGLPAYCRDHRLPHGIAHDLTEEIWVTIGTFG
jgi:glycerol-1-phosphate dehydrogenase [NAD(P)+]